MEARVRGVSALLSVLLAGCGSHVVVAEQADARAAVTTESDADVGEAAFDQGILTCGHVRCTNHPAMIAGGVALNGLACCFDAKRSACGVAELDNCFPLNMPGHRDESCQPALNTVLGDLPGCCTPSNTCGSLETTIGIGCVQIPLVTPLPIGRCNYSP